MLMSSCTASAAAWGSMNPLRIGKIFSKAQLLWYITDLFSNFFSFYLSLCGLTCHNWEEARLSLSPGVAQLVRYKDIKCQYVDGDTGSNPFKGTFSSLHDN